MKDLHRKIWKHIAGPFWMVCDPVTKVCKPALKHHWDKKYKHHGHMAPVVLIFDLVLLSFLGMLVVGGIFFYFVLPAFPAPQFVRLEAKVPVEAISGQQTAVSVSYRNETGGTLGCALLKVTLPEMFAPSTMLENNAPETCVAMPVEEGGGQVVRRHLGDVPAGAMGEVSIKGTSYGKVGAVQTANVELLYWQEGKASPSRTVSRAEWTITGSVVSLNLEPGADIVRGRQMRMTVHYKNESDARLEGLVIRLAAPEDFRLIGSDPGQSDPAAWWIPSLEAGESGEIAVTGIMRTVAEPTAPTFDVSAWLGDSILMLNEVRVNADVRTTGFELSHDMTAEKYPTLTPGQEVKVTVRYKNGGSQTIRDLHIALEPDLTLIEEVSPADLKWDKNSVPEMATVAPGDSGELTANFRVRQSFPEEASADGAHPALAISARADYLLEDDLTRPLQADTALMMIPISTLLDVRAAAFYYTQDGEQLGVGPLPPKVGERTKYRVVVYITNTTNDVEDAWFEAYLPPNVEWTGRYSVTSGESMDYFASNGRVRWKVGLIPSHSDVSARIGASFEVALTPTEADAGSSPLLAGKITVSGVDSATGAKVEAVSPDITTFLEFDDRAEGKGIVVR